jgi:hypothetical protein
MIKDGRAVAFQVLVEPQAGTRLGQHTSKRGLAHSSGSRRHVVAVQLDQVKSVEENVAVMPAVADTLERRDATLAPTTSSNTLQA